MTPSWSLKTSLATLKRAKKTACRRAERRGEIGFTIISLTFSLIAVLIPLLFMGDIVGRLFREFAITPAVAILISAVVSLTLTPMMCARMLSHESLRKQKPLFAGQRAFLRAGDCRLWPLAKPGTKPPMANVERGVKHPGVIDTAVGFYPKRLLPNPGITALFRGTLQAPQSVSFASMAQRQQQVSDLILKDPAVESLTSFVGVDGTNPALNSARLQINLKTTG